MDTTFTNRKINKKLSLCFQFFLLLFATVICKNKYNKTMKWI